MGKYKRKTASTWTEDDMQKAIEAFRQGRSQRHAADFFGVPHSCLQRRLQGGQDIPTRTKGGQTIFTKDQEKELVSRILKLSARGFPLDSTDVRKTAYEFADSNKIKHTFSETKKMAGKEWLMGFRERNPNLSLRKAEGLSLARCNGLNREDVAEFFSLLRKTLEDADLMDKPQLIYNADESGCQLNNKPTRKVFAEKGSRAVYAQTCVERGELVTVLACTNATGNFIPPMAIFKGKRFLPEFSDGFPNGSLITMTDSGWINEEAFMKWLQHFEAHRVPGPCILLLDGHASHKTLQALQFCEDHNINMICLPSHTTHRLQPLDRSFFKPLKSYYDNECMSFMRNTKGERKISKLTFGRIFKAAWMKAATPAIAESGFRSTGVFPLNENAVAEHEFLPAGSSSNQDNPPDEIQPEPVSPPASPVHTNSVQSPNSSVSFQDLLPSPNKTTPKRSDRKQKSVLLTSPANIKETKERLERKRKLIPQQDNSVRREIKNPARNRSTSESSESNDDTNEEDSDTSCGFCKIKYSDQISVKLGDWIQCQGKGREWYHEKCVGAAGKKRFVCGKCVVRM